MSAESTKNLNGYLKKQDAWENYETESAEIFKYLLA